jgi:hypothetical protein
MTESVNHPDHYTPGQYEVYKVCEAWGLHDNAYLFNVVKYVARAGKKNPEKMTEDLEKALWYLKREVELQRGLNAG